MTRTERGMNWISSLLVSVAMLTSAACNAPATEAQPEEPTYGLHYQVMLLPDSASARVTMTVSQSASYLREYRFRQSDSISDVSGAGTIETADGATVWKVPENGGELIWRATLSNKRSESGFDALLTNEFGVFRAEDLIPRAQSTVLKGSRSETTLDFSLPEGWSVITEYSALTSPISVVRPGRQLSQPTGWIAAGKLGVRRDTIAGTQVVVAGPLGQNIRRLDMLALLNWTLPEIYQVFGETPERITIISADDPMWRGGLSAPASLFLHADRPLISENATSTLLHELMHVVLGIKAAPGYDWVVEGFAEYYSLDLLHRSGAITTRRHARALETQEAWSEDATALCAASSRGPTTALAVVTMRALDAEIRRLTNSLSSLDNLAADLRNSETPVDLNRIQTLVAELIGEESTVLRTENLPGCDPQDI